MRRRAVFALSRSDQPEMVDTLIALAKDDHNPRVRGEALFWLAQAAREKAIGPISDAIANDPDTAVKKRAVFALSQLPKDEGVPRLIEVARSEPQPRGAQTGDVLAGSVQGPEGVGVLRRDSREVIKSLADCQLPIADCRLKGVGSLCAGHGTLRSPA